MSTLNQAQKNKLNELCDELKLSHYTDDWHELSWKVLNRACAEYNLNPEDIVEQIKLYGIVCFNDSLVNHPIDYLYETVIKLMISKK